MLLFKWSERHFVRNHVFYEHQDAQHLVTRLFIEQMNQAIIFKILTSRDSCLSILHWNVPKIKINIWNSKKNIARWTISLSWYLLQEEIFCSVKAYQERFYWSINAHNGSIAKHRYDTEVNEFHSVMGEIVPQYVISAVFCEIFLCESRR